MSLSQKAIFFKCLVFTALTFLCCFDETTAQQCSRIGCEDCYDWCESLKNFVCDNPEFRQSCRKTCKACPTNAEACLSLQCSQRCILSKDGSKAECACEDGFQMDKDGRTCDDIDECAVNGTALCENSRNGTLCYNLVGSYTCISCSGVGNSNIWNYHNRNECCARDNEEKCGKSITNIYGKVLGGKNTKIRSWPWTVFLVANGSPCGGSLITRNYFVTAAHCVENKPLNEIIAFLGTENTTDDSNIHAQSRKVKKIHIHPDYNYPYNDIAVVMFDEPAFLRSDYVSPICLPNGEEPKSGEVCYAAGFGRTELLGSTSNILQEVDLPIVDEKTCSEAYSDRDDRINSTTQFCAGYREGGKDTCEGDSGGPLMCQRCNSCNWYLAGVTSFGRSCGQPNSYGVYVKVRNFEQWITSITSQTLNQQTCVRPAWQQWGSWNQCSVSCGKGSRTRTRSCKNGSVGEAGCIGRTRETIDCDAGECLVWSSCSVTCGVGIESRVYNGTTETRICVVARNCPTWSEYGEWGECSLTCGGGIRKSSRRCLNGSPGEEGCLGSTERQGLCNTQCCPSWSEFSPFSSCSVTCGGGIMTSNRTCRCGVAGDVGCNGSETRFALCGTEECPKFSQWTEFDSCSAKCDGGVRIRTRTCSKPDQCAPDEHGVAIEQIKICNTRPCGTWGAFGEYGSCSVSCGGGTQSRTRQCFDGICFGEAKEERACNKEKCPAAPTVSMCSSVKNVMKEHICCQWARQNYCQLYSSYMSRNCAKSCCEFKREGDCMINACVDRIPTPTCKSITQHCDLPSVQNYCRATCDACK